MHTHARAPCLPWEDSACWGLSAGPELWEPQLSMMGGQGWRWGCAPWVCGSAQGEGDPGKTATKQLGGSGAGTQHRVGGDPRHPPDCSWARTWAMFKNRVPSQIRRGAWCPGVWFKANTPRSASIRADAPKQHGSDSRCLENTWAHPAVKETEAIVG